MRNATFHSQSNISAVVLLTAGFVMAFFIYYTTMSDSFLLELDDDWLILNNQHIRYFSFRNILFLLFQDTTDLSYQPLMYISLSLDYYLFGLDASAIKLENLIFHLINGILVFQVFKELTKKPMIAAFTAAIFLLHPIQVENIAWASCRRQVLFGFFYFLTLLSFIRLATITRERRIWGIVFFVSCILAFLSKFTAVIILPSIFFLGVQMHKVTLSEWGNILRKYALQFVFLVVIIPIFAFKNAQSVSQNWLDLKQDLGYSGIEYALISIKSFSFYIFKTLIPLNFSHYYPENTPGHIIWNWEYSAYAFATIFVVVLCTYKLIMSRFLSFSFLAIFLASIAPSATRMWLYSDSPWNNGDRYVYTALPFLISFVLLCFGEKLSRRSSKVLIYGILAVLSFSTYQYSLVWKNSNTLFEHILSLYPNSEFYRRLATVQVQTGNYDDAWMNLQKANNSPNKMYINVPYYTHLQVSYLYWRFNQKQSWEEEFDMAMSKLKGKIAAEQVMACQLSGEYNNFEEYYYAALRCLKINTDTSQSLSY